MERGLSGPRPQYFLGSTHKTRGASLTRISGLQPLDYPGHSHRGSRLRYLTPRSPSSKLPGLHPLDSTGSIQLDSPGSTHKTHRASPALEFQGVNLLTPLGGHSHRGSRLRYMTHRSPSARLPGLHPPDFTGSVQLDSPGSTHKTRGASPTRISRLQPLDSPGVLPQGFHATLLDSQISIC
jgi:hypothetical protein